jgi:hypothetical protein
MISFAIIQDNKILRLFLMTHFIQSNGARSTDRQLPDNVRRLLQDPPLLRTRQDVSTGHAS